MLVGNCSSFPTLARPIYISFRVSVLDGSSADCFHMAGRGTSIGYIVDTGGRQGLDRHFVV
jgi:hypothetical protein